MLPAEVEVTHFYGTLAMIFHFELAPKKVVSDSFEVHLKVSK
jgi:hypothetical protein